MDQRPAAEMRRIVILGNAGSGKSTLARRIGEALAVPVIHLDLLFWGTGWTEPDPDAFCRRVRAAVSGDRWVCEGNYARRTFDLRLPQADAVIWLETPCHVCIGRVLWRSATRRHRPDIPAGCTERLDRQFLGFLSEIWHFDRDRRPDIERRRLMHGPGVPVLRLRGEPQIAACIRSLARSAAPPDDAPFRPPRPSPP